MAPSITASLFVCLVLVSSASAHLCLIEPHQRGALDVSTSGNPTCFRHGGPCGKQPNGPIAATYQQGDVMFVKFQQNYNHYEVGFPGWLDVAWTNNSNPTSDDDFEVLQVLPDTNEHFQAHQNNYTLTFQVPNVVCANCILRIRYEPNKPGESRFYQCADFAIVKSSQPAIPVSSAVLYGVAFDELDNFASRSEYVSVDVATGAINFVLDIPFALRSADANDADALGGVNSPFILDQIATYDPLTRTHYFLASSTGPVGAFPDRILSVANGQVRLKALPNLAFPINAIDFRPATKQLIYLSIETVNATTGIYKCRVGSLDPASGTATTLVYTDPDDTFVNSQWTALDDTNGIYYLLMGNENAPDSLETRLYTVDLNAGNITKIASPDFSIYTISSIFFYKGALFTLSPGLVGGNTTWTLVTVDANTGAVKPVSTIAPAGAFLPYYGGAVFGFDSVNGLLYYQFLVADQQTSVIATISLDTGRASFSKQSVLRHIHNLSYLSA